MSKIPRRQLEEANTEWSLDSLNSNATTTNNWFEWKHMIKIHMFTDTTKKKKKKTHFLPLKNGKECYKNW